MPRHDVNRRCGKNARITITCLTAFVLAGMLPTPAAAQPVIQTYSTGAPGDPYNKPVSLAVDSAGNVFVADKGNHRVQRIDKNTQAVTTVVGTGVAGYGGDSGAGSQAQLDCPSSIAFDSAGALYVADPCQNVVRKVSTGADQFISGASDEIITTLVGNGTRDACVWTDGVPANQTSVDSPYQVVVDKGGNVFVLSADCTDLVRRVDAISGLITTTNFYTGYLGSNAMAFDRFGNLFLSYFGQIYVYSPSNGPYLTGTETSSTQVSYFGISPLPRAFDSAGSLYFSDDTCDCSNGDLQIFKADSGVILFAGTGISGYSGDGGSPLDASFRGPAGMAGDDIGNLFIADSGNNVIRLVTPGATAPLLESYPPNPSNQTTATFAFSSSDSRVTSFLCTLDGSEAPCVSPVTYSNLSDGSHTFSVVGETSAGDPSSPLSYTWVVDTVPPPMPSIDAHPSNPSASANAAFAFSDAEAGVSFRCTLDGAGGFCSTPAAYTGLADGAHTFSVTATDAAGNPSVPDTFSWVIRTTVPPAPRIDSSPAVLSNQSAPAFSFSDSQAGVTFTCQVDAQQAPCTSPAIYVGLADGKHTFSVIATDPVAGRSSAPATFTWTKDTTPPKMGSMGGPASVVIPNPSVVFFRPGSNDIVGYLCSLDGGGFSPCSSPVSFNITAPGDHGLEVEAVDAAGNVGDPESIGWKVTYCSCERPGDYSNPAFNDTILTTSPSFRVRVTYSADGLRLADVSLVDSGGNVVYSLPTTVRGWQFSPDGAHFVFLTSLPYPNSPVEASVLDLSVSPARRILTVSNVGGAVEFSPSGTYLMVVGAITTTQYSVSVYRVGDVSTGVLAYTTSSFGATAAWGFNNNGDRESAFLFAFASGQDTVTWSVGNLETGRQSISQNSPLGSAYWQFNPCGNIIALVSYKQGFSEQVDLFSTQTGVHLGGTSFPVQTVTLSSAFGASGSQEVAKIGSPAQTLPIVDDRCGSNTTTGSNVTVSPTCSQSNNNPVTVTFSDVSQDGGTGVNESSTGTAPPGDFQIGDPPVYYDIATSATYSGDITICISYAGITFSGTPRLFHFENGAWVDRTTSFDATTQTVCGTVTSLSPFALFSEAATEAPVFTSASGASFQAGVESGFTVLTTGRPTARLSESGALPAGVAFVDNHDGSAILTGTPTSTGTFPLTFVANSDGSGQVTQAFTLVVTGTSPDTTAPLIVCASPDTAWHAANVSIACTATDSGSGLANASDASFMLTTTVAPGAETAIAQTATRTVCDVAGNCSVAGPVGPIMVDRKNPAVALTTPADGAVFVLNQPVTAGFSCADGGSGVGACSGGVANGSPVDTSSVGAKTMTVVATDNAGNQSSVTHSYTVAYAQSGTCAGDAGHQILAPIDANGTSVWKQGRTVPAKFRVCDARGVSIGTPGVVAGFALVEILGDTVSDVDQTVSSTSADTAFRWDPASQQWVFNISTASLAAGKTYVYAVQLNDGSAITFRFGLR